MALTCNHGFLLAVLLLCCAQMGKCQDTGDAGVAVWLHDFRSDLTLRIEMHERRVACIKWCIK